ncbi:mechanosensitive ion channel family protein [Rhizobium lentis]|uniref:Mechanosensitive ion channel family protein n=1 Tax=Rhizobium lentis TaxID=1138194 RepID=A0ABS7ID40_9HYPH|nr:mechanosensitive ion channel family protein [Rhizobium lentis]MBX5088446.1 mechanosensitive ion channel family protein [Rhizobium lentis]
MRWLSILLSLFIASAAAAQAPVDKSSSSAIAAPAQATQAKVDDLLRLLQDADVRELIQARYKSAAPQAETSSPNLDEGMSEAMTSRLAAWEEQTRDHINAVFSAVPQFPSELQKVVLRLHDDAMRDGYASLSVVLAVLGLAGMVAELVFRKQWWHHGGGLGEFVPILVFAAVMTVLFFAVEWPPLVRVVVACYLSAFVAYRVFSTLVRMTSPTYVHRRLRLAAGLLMAGIATAQASAVLGMDQHVLDAVWYFASLLALAMAVEFIWSKPRSHAVSKIGLTLYAVGLWLIWLVDLEALFWIGIYAVSLPAVLHAVTHGVRNHISIHLSIPASDNRNVLAVRGSRAIVIALAVGWIAMIWEIDTHSASMGDPRFTALFYGILKSIMVLLMIDLAWHLAKAAIDRNFGPADGEGSEVGPHATRLCTLLPILRNVLAVCLFVISGMIVLSQLGVEIGPLIAGAGIFGVAIGFGSQTLVKDVISGFFYLFDDAFRVGEYIQAKDYKGTVEGFSLRSIRLRHSRGPIFTIPFGELGAVENMSRDWSKTKITVTVPYDTDLEKARRIGKTIGQDLMNDPEIGSLFIEPMKMKGVEEFGAYGVVIGFAMITVPSGQQSFIRRRAYAMLREAFQTKGIAFAQPTIQVGGGDKGADVSAGVAFSKGDTGAKVEA